MGRFVIVAYKPKWAEFEAACDHVPLASLAESQNLFAEFEPIAL